MNTTRRTFLGAAAALASPLASRAADLSGLRIGVTDWNLRQTGKTEAVGIAKEIGFDGVEVSLGRRIVDDKLPLDNAEMQAQYLAEFAKQGFRIAGTCLDILHTNYLKNDKLGQKWVADGIQVTKKLKARVMLLPFFGKGALQTHDEMDFVGDALRELGPEAEKAGVLLGLEDTTSAENNVRIMDRSRSKAVMTYYDIGNSTGQGFDVVKEIRWLGGKRICQFHLKDNPGYLGEGKIDVPGVIRAIGDIGYSGFANLETNARAQAVDEDMKRNLGYVRRLVKEASGA